MKESAFVSHFRHRAWRQLPRPAREPELVSRLELRPARFLVGLEEKVRWQELKEAQSSPVNVAFYLGRVEEVAGDEVVATVWERPSGREASTTLSVREHFAGQSPPPGSMLRIWTWVELPGSDQRVDRFKIEVERAVLSPQERQSLKGLLKSWEADAPARLEDEG